MKTSTTKYVNEINLDYTRHPFSRVKVSSSRDAETISRQIYTLDKCKIDLKEYFYVLMLNRANNVIGYLKLSEGGISQTVVDLRLAFGAALKCLASSLILVHNHPSGNLTASAPDKELTKNFCNAGKFLEINVLDHIILSSDGYMSMADEGVM